MSNQPEISVVVCVHNALSDIRKCLKSLLQTIDVSFEIVLVDDGSDEETASFLKNYSSNRAYIRLLRNDSAEGFTRALNKGVKSTQCPIVVSLNSDTEVGPYWLRDLNSVASRKKDIGLVGPISNAAGYQSAPLLFTTDKKHFEINKLPDQVTIQEYTEFCRKALKGIKPVQFPILNGFCLLIKKKVFEEIGYFDEISFPEGYGEETDFCLRAMHRGFKQYVCPQVYVHHAKARSFGHIRRTILNRRSGLILQNRYSEESLEKHKKTMAKNRILEKIRRILKRDQDKLVSGGNCPMGNADFRILFLLPVKGSSGGAHSVVQEATRMRLMGVPVQIAIPLKYQKLYQHNYPQYSHDIYYFYQSEDDLIRYAGNFDICIATIFTTVKILKKITQFHRRIIPAYYIQDYEPWFEPEGSELQKEALASYSLIPDILAFAKTNWIRKTVQEKHDIPVHKVEPSIDHSIFYPPFSLFRDNTKIIISAMVRPNTPRRNAGFTLQILKEISREFGNSVSIEIFGAKKGDRELKKLDSDFQHLNHGVLRQREVAQVLRKADIFLDLSTYQAFGRTALEAMACGCAVVVPKDGGTDEYARNEKNAFCVDTNDEDEVLKVVRRLIENQALREKFQKEAVATANRFSVYRAAVSEVELFRKEILKRSGGF